MVMCSKGHMISLNSVERTHVLSGRELAETLSTATPARTGLKGSLSCVKILVKFLLLVKVKKSV